MFKYRNVGTLTTLTIQLESLHLQFSKKAYPYTVYNCHKNSICAVDIPGLIWSLSVHNMYRLVYSTSFEIRISQAVIIKQQKQK